jgi:hypothetical protein
LRESYRWKYSVKCNSSCKKPSFNSRNCLKFPYTKASLTSERLQAGAEQAFVQQSPVLLLSTFRFISGVPAWTVKECCEGSNRWKHKTAKIEANWNLPFTQSVSCNSLTGGRVFCLKYKTTVAKINILIFQLSTKILSSSGILNKLDSVIIRKCLFSELSLFYILLKYSVVPVMFFVWFYTFAKHEQGYGTVIFFHLHVITLIL